jgi:serine/threonine protein kinase/CHASE2 domain-containing sensor protein
MQAIFEAAVDLAASERQEYLSAACGGDAELRARLERLIQSDEDTATVGGPLDQLPQQSSKECRQCSRCYDDPISRCPLDGATLEIAFPGSLLIDGKYRVERCLGRGGMGAVYLAKHALLEKYFALKLIATDGPIPQSYRKNFENEALALGRLKHPNIVDVTDYGVDSRRGGLPYLVMEYLEGQTIRQVLKQRQWLPFPDAVALLRAVAAAIDCAHDRNIVHGDLKPGNLFLARQPDGSDIVKVVDFGLARLSAAEHQDSGAGGPNSGTRSTASGAIRGTPAYIAPELLRGNSPSPQSDRFAFGVLTYEILTGSQPFDKHAFEARQKPPQNPSTSNSNLPAELDSPILRLLDKTPELRPSSAAAVVSEMEEQWLNAEQRKWRQREGPRRYLFALLAASFAVLIAGWLASSRVARILEGRTADLRFALAPKGPPDPHLLVVALDDNAIAEDPRPIAQWDGKFADLVERIADGGARAVVLDVLLPASWSESRRFARVVELHSDHIGLATFSESGKVIGTECIGPLTAQLIGPERYLALFGFANLEEDEDRRIRKERSAFSDREGMVRPSLAARAVGAATLQPAGFTLHDGAEWIDYSISPRDIPRLAWKDASERPPAFFNDKLVLIGADYSGSNDRHRVPATADPGWVSGIVIHAMIANTIIRGYPVRDAGPFACLGFMSAACLGTLALALQFPHRPSWAIAASAASFGGYALIAFAMFRVSRTMLVLVAPETALLLSCGIAWRLRSRLAPYPVKGA